MPELKLFVWKEFCRDYCSGLAFAIAHDETEARKLILEEKSYAWGWDAPAEVYPLDSPMAFCVTGGS